MVINDLKCGIVRLGPHPVKVRRVSSTCVLAINANI